MTSPATTQQTLPSLNRYITTNDENGKSVFSSTFSSSPPSRTLPDGARVIFCYGSETFPVAVTQDRDLQSYQRLVDNPPGIVLQQGVVFRIIELPPGYTSAMHRTLSVNFNVVLEGQLELILDSGGKRILNRGDSAIQRVVNHSWRNTSQTEWARMIAVPVPAEAFSVGAGPVEISGIPGMSAS